MTTSQVNECILTGLRYADEKDIDWSNVLVWSSVELSRTQEYQLMTNLLQEAKARLSVDYQSRLDLYELLTEDTDEQQLDELLTEDPYEQQLDEYIHKSIPEQIETINHMLDRLYDYRDLTLDEFLDNVWDNYFGPDEETVRRLLVSVLTPGQIENIRGYLYEIFGIDC